MKRLLLGLVLLLVFSPSLVFAVEPVANPEPISSSLFIVGGAALLIAKFRKKK